MRDFVLATCGGFLGVTSASALVLLLVRLHFLGAWTKLLMDKITKDAHEKDVCPVCKRAMRHDRDENHVDAGGEV